MDLLIVGVIDIGTNTTRLLVAECTDAGLKILIERRSFVAPRRPAGGSGSIGFPDEMSSLLAAHAQLARANGATEVMVVGTAALRRWDADGALRELCEPIGAISVRILSEREEAELAFRGATAALAPDRDELTTVVDLGGGSVELATGSARGPLEWWASRPVGTRVLTESHLPEDPPGPTAIEEARLVLSRVMAGLRPPRCGATLVVGGGAGALRSLGGAELSTGNIAELLDELMGQTSSDFGAQHGIAPQRARLLPAALLIFEALTALLPSPFQISAGGMREGLVLERAVALGLSPSPVASREAS